MKRQIVLSHTWFMWSDILQIWSLVKRWNGLWPAPRSGVNSLIDWRSRICASSDSTPEQLVAHVRLFFTVIIQSLGHDSVKRADEGETADRDRSFPEWWLLSEWPPQRSVKRSAAPVPSLPSRQNSRDNSHRVRLTRQSPPCWEFMMHCNAGLCQHTLISLSQEQKHWKGLKWVNADFDGRWANLVVFQTVNVDQQGATRTSRNTVVNVSKKYSAHPETLTQPLFISRPRSGGSAIRIPLATNSWRNA